MHIPFINKRNKSKPLALARVPDFPKVRYVRYADASPEDFAPEQTKQQKPPKSLLDIIESD
jgi:hypothetical protein